MRILKQRFEYRKHPSYQDYEGMAHYFIRGDGYRPCYVWLKNGKEHRADGPAVEYLDSIQPKYSYLYEGDAYGKQGYWQLIYKLTGSALSMAKLMELADD